MVKPTRPLLAAVIAAALACGDEPPVPWAPTPTLPEPNRTTSGLSILGAPSSLHIGQTAQLRATAQYVDGGGFVDVTAQASWQSSNEQACRVSAGMLTSAAAGTATITARHGTTSATATVACGYVITAVVHENPPTLDVRLPDTRVEVVGGPLDGQVFLTDAQGRATLPPVADAGFFVYFKKRGYDDLRFEIFELPRQSELDISMLKEPSERIEFSGPCNGQFTDYEFSLPTQREGRVRASIRTVGTFGLNQKAWAAVYKPGPLDGSPALLVVSDPANNIQAADAERVVLPGLHPVGVHTSAFCFPGASWHLVLEYTR